MEKKQNVPALRFPGFSGEWERRQLKEIGTIMTGNTPSPSHSEYYSDNGIFWVTPSDIMDVIVTNTSRKLSLKGEKVGRIAAAGSILVTCIASIGKNALLTVNGGFNQQINSLTPSKDYDSSFLLYESFSWSEKMKREAAAGTMQIVNKTEFSEIFTTVPTHEEQSKIGQILKYLENKLTFQRRKIQKLQQFRQAMLTKLFPREGAAEPELRFRGFSGKWESHYLGMLGVTFSGLSGKTKADFGHGKARFVPYLNVFNHPIADLQETEAIEIDDKQNEVKYGDIFFTTSSETPEEVGMSSVWLGNERNVYLNSFCFGYRPTSILYPFFMAFLLRSSSIRKKFIFLAQGISRYNISKNKVMEIEIPVPSFEEQKAIGNFFYRLDTYISLQQKKLERMQRLKAALLEKMFV